MKRAANKYFLVHLFSVDWLVSLVYVEAFLSRKLTKILMRGACNWILLHTKRSSLFLVRPFEPQWALLSLIELFQPIVSSFEPRNSAGLFLFWKMSSLLEPFWASISALKPIEPFKTANIFLLSPDEPFKARLWKLLANIQK